MTRYLLDVASYQGDLRSIDVWDAGFGINLKVSHGLGQKSVHPEWRTWATKAKAASAAISTFHYLTAEASGEEQAEYAYRRIAEAGLLYGTAHQLDVESSPAPPLSSVRGYLTRMAALLGRPIALYTGDWWWQARGPTWVVTDLAPYLWAPPTQGYLGSYPGDASAHWVAGFGGWRDLAVMQYAVSPLPGGTIKVSKSAIRNESVWRDLTQGRPGMSYAPASILSARTFVMNTLRGAGESVDPNSFGVVGDDSHANAGTGYHLGKDALKSTAYSIVESSRDRNGLTNAAAAFDHGWFSISVKSKAHNLRTFSVWLVAQCKASTPDTRDIREVIYSPDGQTVKRWDRLAIRTTGDSSHTSHTHISYFRDSESRDKTALFRRYYTEIGLLEDPDMPTLDDADINKILYAKIVTSQGDFGSLMGVLGTLMVRTGWIGNEAMPAALDAIKATLANVRADDADTARILAAVDSATAASAKAAGDAVRATFAEGTPDDIAAALVAALGPSKAAAVGAILNG